MDEYEDWKEIHRKSVQKAYIYYKRKQQSRQAMANHEHECQNPEATGPRAETGEVAMAQMLLVLVIARVRRIYAICCHIDPETCICDQIWENPPYGIFRDNRDHNIYQ